MVLKINNPFKMKGKGRSDFTSKKEVSLAFAASPLCITPLKQADPFIWFLASSRLSSQPQPLKAKRPSKKARLRKSAKGIVRE